MSGDGYAEVTKDEARQVPYPVVYVNSDGTYRECTESERKYLQTGFHPGDGARPYVKDSYSQKSPDGDMSGFLFRYQLPKKARASK